MNPFVLLSSQLDDLCLKLGYSFQNVELLVLALTHCSFLNECKEADIGHNERLELLGDSVLNLLVTEFLYNKYSDQPEGELSRLRAQLVDSTACLRFVQKLDVGHALLLGKGEQRNDGKGRESILANLFEALLGAIYLDGGLVAARQFLFAHFQTELEAVAIESTHNPKARLQDYIQKKYQETPVYEVVAVNGPDHQKDFVVCVLFQQKEIGRGSGGSKKIAQNAAAVDALNRLNVP